MPGGVPPDRGDAIHFAWTVLMSIGPGGKGTSPFLHTTSVLQVAHKWQRMGRELRGDMANYLVRINRDMLEDHLVVDMSSRAAQELL